MPHVTDADILALHRPHPRLLTLYLIRSVLSGPALVILGPLLFFRYQTMRFRFDEQGIHMRWGLLFRRQVNLTYARIQDIHLTSGLIQRWLGLADIQVQTASGSAGAEMTIEGLLQFEAIREFLYARMRGYADTAAGARDRSRPGVADDGACATALLREAVDELRATRVCLERQVGRDGPGDRPHV
ncbi:MAG: PH domain-containing protein [Planctomycetes bacterium]|nr:PH domain-containing protein [Planctomycetota bacterium]